MRLNSGKSVGVIVVVLVGCLIGLTGCNNPVSDAERLQNDIKAIDDYLSSNNITHFTDVSGLRFTITSLGTAGLPPRRTHKVTVKYTGHILNTNVIFEQSTLSDTLGTFLPTGLIEGLEILPEGTFATLYLPSALGYGNQQSGSVPPNSILVYDVQLIDVTPSAKETEQLQKDIAAIDKYLADNSITAQTAPFGVRYVITSPKTAPVAGWYDKIQVSYTGKLMKNSTIFFNGSKGPSSGFDSRVIDYLQGLEVGFQVMPLGSRATFYIPSTLGFGSSDLSDSGIVVVPANSNLIYDVSSIELAK